MSKVTVINGKPAGVVIVPAVARPAAAGPVDGGALAAHIADTTPHPEYDDLPSLTLLLENGLA